MRLPQILGFVFSICMVSASPGDTDGILCSRVELQSKGAIRCCASSQTRAVGYEAKQQIRGARCCFCQCHMGGDTSAASDTHLLWLRA